MKNLLLLFLPCLLFSDSHAQTLTTNHAHSHNDYKQNIPFLKAYYAGAGSIEADVYLLNGKLYVAHERKEIAEGRTLNELYLKPLAALFRKNNGMAYPDPSQTLQLVIDIKEDHVHVISQLIKELAPYQDVFNAPANKNSVKIVLSGDMPEPALFSNYPDYIYYDGRPNNTYSTDQLKHIAMISDNLADYTKWNGKGSLTAPDSIKLQKLINSAHAKHKPFRFWATQDSPNSWIQLEKLGVDWINTDHPEQVHDFYVNRYKLMYVNPVSYPVYTPTYKTDGANKKIKNIILLIGDGMGLAEIQAGLTTNHGHLNMLQCRYMGFSQTAAANSDNTDSAAGATAMAAGVKTNNRYIGVNAQGKMLTNLPDTLAHYGIKSGIISCGDITDATPAAFYAHEPERSSSQAIAADMLQSKIDVLVGSNQKSFFNNADKSLITKLQKNKFQIDTTLADFNNVKNGKHIVLLNDSATKPIKNGRGDMLRASLLQTIKVLSTNKNGFFIMAEGAQIDHGGHENDLPFLITELHDFDKTVAEALKFADKDGETLVIITADHETGGLSLLDASTAKGMVLGNFSTNDHTSINVPVLAYGPGSQHFIGTYQNTEIFHKLLNLITNN
ncbi:alkaline phosphatase [Mucilaginibacter sp.]|uniref:alkaline phosphatase n=1 Tax=Mucilaginibacter sp. TaxID=1882438 RepID=UPI00356426CD